MICYIVGAGDFCDKIHLDKNSLIIAADGGYDSLKQHGYNPDILIGDFDSINADIPSDIRTVKHPKEKDETDMFLAYREGVRLGYTDFVMLGATGGRLDHTYANLSLILYAREEGHTVTAIDEGHTILCIKNEKTELFGNMSDTFSVFAIGGEARGVTIKNAKYNVENGTLSPSFPLGVSNELTGEAAEISVTDGALLVIKKNG